MTERLPGIRPRNSLGRQLDMAGRRAFPAASTCLLLVAASAPIGLPGQAELQQAVALGCVFFWSVFRPASLPPIVVFLLGLLTDLLGFAPLGVAVFVLLVAHGLALHWRRNLVRQGFVLVWLMFVAVGCGGAAVQWLVTSVLTFRLLPPGPAVFQAALSVGLYPALAMLLTRAHHTLAEPGRA